MAIRHFIRLTHHALSAMLDFGMEFETIDGMEIHVASMMGKCMARNIPHLEDGDHKWPVYYIKQRSEHLLNPQAGDLVKSQYKTNDWPDSYFILTEGFNVEEAILFGWSFTIIQRQGKPFPPIETEVTS